MPYDFLYFKSYGMALRLCFLWYVTSELQTCPVPRLSRWFNVSIEPDNQIKEHLRVIPDLVVSQIRNS